MEHSDVPALFYPGASRLQPRHLPVISSLAISLVAGFLSAALFRYPALSSAIQLLWSLGLNICMFAWIRQDAERRGYKLHRSFSLYMVLFGVLAFLYYLFRSDRFEQALVSLGYFVLVVIFDFGFYLAAVIAALIIVLLVQGEQAIR